MNLAERTDALLALVELYRADRCVALLQPAEAEARTLVRAALADARRRVGTAIAEERKRLRGVVGALEAALHTERRLVAQQHEVQLLARSWDDLRTALVSRWADSQQRARWVETHLARTRTALADDDQPWRIRHHSAWSAGERRVAAAGLESQAISVDFAEDPQMGAGFVVTCGHNVLDASLDGLLADRALLEGRLLQLLAEGSQ
jgi:hypothetical protein